MSQPNFQSTPKMQQTDGLAKMKKMKNNVPNNKANEGYLDRSMPTSCS